MEILLPKKLHIRKWIFFAISSFNIIEEMASGLLTFTRLVDATMSTATYLLSLFPIASLEIYFF